MKIVINTCFGGFSLSNKAIKRYLELKGEECYFYKQTKWNYSDGYEEYTLTDENDNTSSFIYCYTKNLGDKITESDDMLNYWFNDREIDRTDKELIKVIEELGCEANGCCAKLKVVEIPDDVNWEIDDYDGIESIEEVHRSWY